MFCFRSTRRLLISTACRHPEDNERTHLLLDVVERVWRVNRETDQNDMRVGVRQRTETVVIFLTRRIPKSEFDVLAINFDIGDVVLEDSGDVDLRGILESALRRTVVLSKIFDSLTTRVGDGRGGRAMTGTNLREGTLGEDTIRKSPVSLFCYRPQVNPPIKRAVKKKIDGQLTSEDKSYRRHHRPR